MATPVPKKVRAHVFEARNKTLREIFIGWSPFAVDELPERHAEGMPGPISHWDRSSHDIVYAELGRGLPAEFIGDFIESYDNAMTIPGWKVIRE